MINDTAVGLLGHALIKTAVSCLHMEDRHFAPFGWNHRQTAIGITQHQYGLGLYFSQHAIRSGNEIADGIGRTCTTFSTVQKEVWLANAQVVKKHPVEFVVIVLPGVY